VRLGLREELERLVRETVKLFVLPKLSRVLVRLWRLDVIFDEALEFGHSRKFDFNSITITT